MVKTVLVVVAAGVGIWAFVRVFKAVRVGASPIAAIKHPTVDVQVAELMAHPERAKTRTGATAF